MRRPVALLLEGDSYNPALHYLDLSMKLGKPGTTVLRLRDAEGHPGMMEVSFFPLEARPSPALPQEKEEPWCWVMHPTPAPPRPSSSFWRRSFFLLLPRKGRFRERCDLPHCATGTFVIILRRTSRFYITYRESRQWRAA
jgi:hypothetical protein